MRFAVGRHLGVLGALALTVTAGFGVPRANAVESATISTHLNNDGTGSMIANSQTNPSDEVWNWDACVPNLSRCAPFATGRIVSTVGAPAGTVFRTMSTLGATALSPLWRGNVESSLPPSVRGPIRANGFVTPIAGAWLGGWEGSRDVFQLSACATQTGKNCTTLTHSNYPGACPEEGATVLDPAYAGEYLRVADRRLGAGPYFTLMYAVGSPYGHEVWPPSPTTSISVVGRIGRATGPRRVKCGPPPLYEASISSRGVASVRCELDCHATLIARDKPRTERLALTLPATPLRPGNWWREKRRQAMALPSDALERLSPGQVDMVVKIDGREAARRVITLRGTL